MKEEVPGYAKYMYEGEWVGVAIHNAWVCCSVYVVFLRLLQTWLGRKQPNCEHAPYSPFGPHYPKSALSDTEVKTFTFAYYLDCDHTC